MSHSVDMRFDFPGFYRAVNRARELRAISWRQVADEVGVSKSTLARMARDRRPDAAGLAALAAWAQLNPAEFVTLPARRAAGR
jgi:transcriptional regulator with XRE-family HTH domain